MKFEEILEQYDLRYRSQAFLDIDTLAPNPTSAILKRATAIKVFPGTGTTQIPLVVFFRRRFF